ncbi:MAG: glucoamylase family protein [Planctomycetales bacterium]
MSEVLANLDPPLRGEPFSAEHLWLHAEELASKHSVSDRAEGKVRFAERFEENCRYISLTYRTITQAVHNGDPLTSDAEWILDNYYIIEEQLREIHEDLPQQYYRELPKLTSGQWAGFPRVYDLAHELIIHTDSSLDEELISGFVAAYQRITPLTTGELWAVPIMLRLVLVENLRRLCSHVLAVRQHREKARGLLGQWEQNRPNPGSHAHLMDSPSLIMQLIECLRDPHNQPYNFTLQDLIHWFGHDQQAIDDCIRCEQHRLAANQVSIGNLITSMRLLTALDWTLFFERVSLVEPILRQDPAHIYSHMDFATRDHYRHQIEEIAKRGKLPETIVAGEAIDLALEAERSETQDPRARHVGFYLIGSGRIQLEHRLKVSPKLHWRIVRMVKGSATTLYLGGIGLGTAIGVWGVGALLHSLGASLPVTLALSLLGLIPVSEVVLAVLNILVTNLLRPASLPKIEFTTRIPTHYQTLIAIPSMLTSRGGVASLLQRIEIHYLSNPEEGLAFALVTDFADAPKPEMPEDAALLQQARAGIDELNARYPSNAGKRFFLLHRKRTWNAADGVWMGWERKRGKLVELNRLLRSQTPTTYITADDLVDHLPKVKYVITLDTDTRLPLGTAKRLVGTMAHPLNRAILDREQGRIIHGYGILQPRITVSLDSAAKSIFSRFCANSPGLDPYSTAVSDVYQDLFEEGSYTGKGIYDVDVFYNCVDDAFPENHILSHDLIEGCFARAGLITDVEFFDDFPTRYDADARRQHRWVRGDWQLLPWLMPSIPSALGPKSNPLSLMCRWKIFENLRRSLLFPTLLLFVLAGWLTLNPSVAMTASGITLFILAMPLLAQTFSTLRHKPYPLTWSRYLGDSVTDLGRTAVQCGLSLAFIPYKAYLMADAIGRTLYRLFISRRHLLEWESADATERRLSSSPSASFINMSWVSAFSMLLVAFLPAGVLVGALPVLLAWTCSPLIGYWISKTLPSTLTPLSESDRAELRMIARKTWAFFERFVGEEDHWLPPDNYQEYPGDKIAHRLSPTNEGLYVISTLAAHDFGFVSLGEMTERLEKNLASLDQLDRHFGHFYNWYDTTTLKPLYPRYVSTADSGNLAVCLLTAHQGVQEVTKQLLLSPRLITGLQDTLNVIEKTNSKRKWHTLSRHDAEWLELEESLAQLRRPTSAVPKDLSEWAQFFEQVLSIKAPLSRQIQNVQKYAGLRETAYSTVLSLLVSQLEGLQWSYDHLFPWLAPLATGRTNTSTGEDLLAAIKTEMEAPLTLKRLVALPELLTSHVNRIPPTPELDRFVEMLQKAAGNAHDLERRLDYLSDRYESLAMEMDFRTVYNPQRRLFSVGYNKEDARLDRSHYDLLASESRLASLVAIAKGDVEHRHWFQLGRTLTVTCGEKSLLSWGGTMFEFLMPPLFMKDYPGSLLETSCRAAVKRQIEYGRQRKVPWGISESAFGAVATNSDYHYQSFGVPGLGLKRGLANDLVISPYSTGLATLIDPVAALENFRVLTSEGAEGLWGYYDAIDYTPERVPAGERRIVVQNYLAHHHGMTLAALANCLLNNWVHDRFQKQPLARAIEVLLQERIPVSVLEFQPQADEAPVLPVLPEVPGPISRRLSTYATARPRTHLLSNGQYNVMVTNSGSGYSRCGNTAMTRWISDPTRDDCGQYIYLRRLDAPGIWSAGYQPTQTIPTAYEVTYSIDKAEFRRRDGDLETLLEVAVSPENNAEIRHVTVTNHSRRAVTVEVTSYAEIVLTDANADLAHPAFSKLFVETEYLPEYRALLARRRPRDTTQQPAWAVHVIAGNHVADHSIQFETDREQFIGRCRTLVSPAALDPGAKLSGSTGPVLDPIFSLRHQFQIPPGESMSVAFVTAHAETREAAIHLADQYHDSRSVQRTFEMAWAQCQVELRHLQISPAGMHLYQRVASAILYPDPAWRSTAEVLQKNRRSQSALWKYGISGDLPIVLLRVSKPEQRVLLRELLSAHEFWHSHGLKVDLVVLNEYPVEYFDGVHQQLQEIIQGTRIVPNKPGGIFLLKNSFVDEEDRNLLDSIASVVLTGDRGGLLKQVENQPRNVRSIDRLPVHGVKVAPTTSPEENTPARPGNDLTFSNQFGGFSPDGREYIVRLAGKTTTPAPWSNIIANEKFGFLVTESGGGYTWSGNSRENKLTNWCNDPIGDTPGEILYLRDEETGEVWTTTPNPIRDSSEYSVHHGRGYSRFVHKSHDVSQELLLSVAPEDPVKFICLKITNDSSRPRRISATYYLEWILGVNRSQTQMHVWTSWDSDLQILSAYNFYPEDRPKNQIAFLKVLGKASSFTGDRSEFLGRNGTYRNPDALTRVELSTRTGAGIDPCGALQTKLSLAPGETLDVVFLLGTADGEPALKALLEKYSTPQAVHDACQKTRDFWDQTLQAITLKTPDPALDLLVNHWLLYQVLCCRIWGRSAFYQSGGAYGFRDQLQDVMALVYTRPEEARKQILRAASRQFEEGDVQHWWHPPSGRGVRTKFSDDYLWLPFVTCHYVFTTGDQGILEEKISYLRSAVLGEKEEERYEHPQISPVTETLYQHCTRALDHSRRYGEHGIPLMGGGDWNDGMNKVGIEGKGESVWLGWFLITALRHFSTLAERRDDQERVTACQEEADKILQALESEAWDGQWYRRAFFDDGAPLGSAQNDECQIDSIAQSWSVVAGANHERSRLAMEQVYSRLVKLQESLILLFTPPFNHSALNPGYVKGYLPGIRENGGQYTHAALWTVLGATLLKQGTKAVELFDLLNPVLLSTPDHISTYRGEPYVVAADVYGEPPHVGRAGWTWYTGSASWMYRVAVESIAGIQIRGDTLTLIPCIPADWPGFEITLKRGQTSWRILIQNPDRRESGIRQVSLNGQPLTALEIPLTNDGKTHQIEAVM